MKPPLKQLSVFIALTIFSLMVSAPYSAQDDACDTYTILQIDTPHLTDAGLDLRELSCVTIFVSTIEDEVPVISHVFVIPETTVGAYLRGVDLTGQDLVGIDFSYANLSEATLIGIEASTVMFIETNFTAADLSDSNLSYAYFNYAVFIDANFANSNLEGAELSDADMTRTDFTDAITTGAIGYDDN